MRITTVTQPTLAGDTPLLGPLSVGGQGRREVWFSDKIREKTSINAGSSLKTRLVASPTTCRQAASTKHTLSNCPPN